jgi:hypothetical protein
MTVSSAETGAVTSGMTRHAAEADGVLFDAVECSLQNCGRSRRRIRRMNSSVLWALLSHRLAWKCNTLHKVGMMGYGVRPYFNSAQGIGWLPGKTI